MVPEPDLSLKTQKNVQAPMPFYADPQKPEVGFMFLRILFVLPD